MSVRSEALATVRHRRFRAAWALLLLPVLGLPTLLVVANRIVVTPEISLYDAVIKDDFKAVRDHLATGTPVDEASESGHTPLFIAIKMERKAMIDFLLAKGASANAEGHNLPGPLQMAASQGNLPLVKRLLERGARVNARAGSGLTALHSAAGSGNLELTRFLIEKGSDLNLQQVNGAAAIHFAAEREDPRLLEFLVSSGADVNLRGPIGRTALHHAVIANRPANVRKLIELGADPQIGGRNGLIPLTSAIYNHRPIAMVELLLRHTKSVNAQNWLGNAPIHFAYRSDLKTLEALLAAGANPNLSNVEGQTPLTFALSNGNDAIANALKRAGAKVSDGFKVQPRAPSKNAFMTLE